MGEERRAAAGGRQERSGTQRISILAPSSPTGVLLISSDASSTKESLLPLSRRPVQPYHHWMLEQLRFSERRGERAGGGGPGGQPQRRDGGGDEPFRRVIHRFPEESGEGGEGGVTAEAAADISLLEATLSESSSPSRPPSRIPCPRPTRRRRIVAPNP